MKLRNVIVVLFLLLALVACARKPEESLPVDGSNEEYDTLEHVKPKGRTPRPEEEEEPEEEEPEEESAPPESSAPAAAYVANSFFIGKGAKYELYLYHPAQLAYSFLDTYPANNWSQPNHAIVKAINALPTLPKTEHNPNAGLETGILLVWANNQKTQFNIYEWELEVNGIFYDLTSAQYETLKYAMLDATTEENAAYQYAQWLIWMNPNQVLGMERTNEFGQAVHVWPEELSTILWRFRFLPVSDIGVYTPGSRGFGSDSFRTTLTFNSGITYTLVLEGDNLYIESNDMQYACHYKVPGGTQTLIDSIRGAEVTW